MKQVLRIQRVASLSIECIHFVEGRLLLAIRMLGSKTPSFKTKTNKNLAIANRSRVSGAHNTSRAFIGQTTR